MYNEVKLCVRHMGTLSDFFNCEVGLLQGETISPILFSLFANDIELFLSNNNENMITLDQLSIYLLLFADDAVIFSETPKGLQKSLDNLYEYCERWKLKVNVEKTKVVIYKKGGNNSQNEPIFYNNEQIEMVQSFNYLGIVLSSGGSFIQTTQALSDKGLKAMGSLFAITKDMHVPVKIMLNLFDSYVTSILCYACEVWGFVNADDIERVHRRFLKRILGVKMSTANSAVYGELGRYPLYINRYVRIIKYFIKLYTVKQTNCILYSTLCYMRNGAENIIRCNNWITKVRDLLQNTGFVDVWMYPESVNANVFIPIFKNRLIDMYIGLWLNDLNVKSSLTLYKELKHRFELSDYLNIIQNFNLRKYISKLRLSSHMLKIESGRHTNIPKNERKCNICNSNDIEDEYHFVIVCPLYTDIRKMYIDKFYYNRPSMHKFILLLTNNKTKVLNKLAIYCKNAFKMRTDTLNANVE